MPQLRVGQCLLERLGGHADRARGNVDPPDLEPRQRLLQTAALHPAEQIGRRHPDVLERHLARLRALVPELAQVARDHEAVGIGVDQQQ